MTRVQKLDTICKPNAHDFVPKRQDCTGVGNINVLELFCRKCGTVCYLTTQEQPESRIVLARPS